MHVLGVKISKKTEGFACEWNYWGVRKRATPRKIKSALKIFRMNAHFLKKKMHFAKNRRFRKLQNSN